MGTLPAPTCKRPLNTTGRKDSTMTLVFASNVHEVEALVTLANVTPKGVDALPESGAGHSSRGTFVNIYKHKTVAS